MNKELELGKPVLLDLFCGAGGCTKGYQEAGFYVVGGMTGKELAESIPPTYTRWIGKHLMGNIVRRKEGR